MAAQNGLDFEGEFNNAIDGLFKNNTTRDISPTDQRLLVTSIRESYLNRLDDLLDEDAMTSNSSTKMPSQQSVKAYVDSLAIRREFGRAYSSELIFDKNEIEGVIHTQTAAITFSVADGGHIADQWSVYGQRIVSDGVSPFNFVGFNHISGISNGDVLEAGTYQFIFWYGNGISRVSLMVPSQEAANLITLSIPGSFAAVAGAGDPETEIDLTWADVSNESSYEIDFGTSSDGPWTALLASPVANATSKTHTGLTAGTQYFYRLRAIGDGVNFNNSGYTTANATTENVGDLTPPTFSIIVVDGTFTTDDADGATDIPVNATVTITATEAIRDQDGTTVITNANLSDYLVVKVDNGAGADIPYTATINAAKTIITINPNVVWPSLDNVFIQISGVEDVDGNHAVTDDATFATSDYTVVNNSELTFGDILDPLITADNADFEFWFTSKDLYLAGPGVFWRKHMTGSRAFIYQPDGAGGISFKIYEEYITDGGAATREVIWPGSLSSGEHTYRMHYKGAIDTNNGLDRCDLYVDGVLYTAGKNLVVGFGAHPWPWLINDTTAPLKAGPNLGQVKDLIVKSANGTVTEISVPVMRSGLDTSGNARHGTWQSL